MEEGAIAFVIHSYMRSDHLSMVLATLNISCLNCSIFDVLCIFQGKSNKFSLDQSCCFDFLTFMEKFYIELKIPINTKDLHARCDDAQIVTGKS